MFEKSDGVARKVGEASPLAASAAVVTVSKQAWYPSRRCCLPATAPMAEIQHRISELIDIPRHPPFVALFFSPLY